MTAPSNPAERAVEQDSPGGTAIIQRIGWDEGTPPRFTATLVFANEPPRMPALVVWRFIPVRVVIADDYDALVEALRNLIDEIETDGGVDTSDWPLLDEAKAALAKAGDVRP